MAKVRLSILLPISSYPTDSFQWRPCFCFYLDTSLISTSILRVFSFLACATEFIVDPAFREQFKVQDPTPRFEHMLQSIPQVAVAPLSHVLEVVAHIASEMWMCFESKDIPLPPWRRMRSLLSKWEGSKKMQLLTHLDVFDGPESTGSVPSAEEDRQDQSLHPKSAFSHLSPSSVIF